MAVGEYPSDDPGLMRALVRHLERLERHPEGGELQELINDALLHCRREHGYVNGSCVAFLHDQLLAYTRDNSRPSPIRLRARLIQQHLALYLPRADRLIPAKGTQPAPDTPHQVSPAHEAAAAGAKASPKQREAQKLNPKPTETVAMESQNTLEQKPAPAAKAPETPHTDTHGTAQHLDELRKIWANSVDELLRERETLAQKLSETHSYLKMIEAEREQLREELNKARKRVRASEKPAKKVLGLPKRDVLVRQIEAEVERVKRHGNPLALALIDVENLDALNDQHGQETADAALKHYTSEILGGFRSYDLVARYNKNEFAVLLPNTDRENAMRALEKVRKRASESHFNHKGRSFPLPGFGGVLTFYAPGEEPHQMLRRADEALVNLKLRGKRERQFVVV